MHASIISTHSQFLENVKCYLPRLYQNIHSGYHFLQIQGDIVHICSQDSLQEYWYRPHCQNMGLFRNLDIEFQLVVLKCRDEIGCYFHFQGITYISFNIIGTSIGPIMEFGDTEIALPHKVKTEYVHFRL